MVDAVQKFREFLDASGNELKSGRLILDINAIRAFSKELATAIISDPTSCIPFMQDEINRQIGFTGSLGVNSLNPRTLTSEFISQTICVEGIVTSMSLVRPKLTKSVHYCDNEQAFYEKSYRDGTMITKLPPTNTVFPTRDASMHPLLSEFGLSEYVDFQTIQIQEMPENSPAGQLPRSIECILMDDLVDITKPGDRIKVYGIYKSFCSVSNLGAGFPTSFKTIILANHVEFTGRFKCHEINLDDQMETFNMLANSNMKYKAIAPTIYGSDHIKKAIALLMVGGNEIIMNNGSKIRGDINILLLGDPSTAKSQMLRYVLNFMPLSIATTGKGSSGVGLTAAVVLDKDTGEKRLEAGAMVLADRGVVCIDEFDKMSDLDRIAIHEVMEQQTVTITKAGIHTALNARCSVLAAANPIMGSYKEDRSIQDNVRLPESLLTRFDLMFITKDISSVEIDNLISKHVLNMHIGETKKQTNISQKLFKDFILFAKKLRPKLTHEAAALISKEYERLRKMKDGSNLFVNITPRMLETLIRLSTAHAKLRLSEQVEEVDAKEAIELLNLSIVKKEVQKPIKKTKKAKTENDTIPVNQEVKCYDDIRDLIWDWRTNNADIFEFEISTIIEELNISESDLKEALKQMVAMELVLFSDNNKIYFLN